jgi:hypothetical protein
MVAVRARSGIGVMLLYVVKKCHKKKFSFLPLYSNASRTSEYHRHRSIHHAISFVFSIFLFFSFSLFLLHLFTVPER